MSTAPEIVTDAAPGIDLDEMDRYLDIIAPDGNWCFQCFDDSDQDRGELTAVIHRSEPSPKFPAWKLYNQLITRNNHPLSNSPYWQQTG